LETPLWGLKIMHSPCVVFSILALLTEVAHNYECCTIFGEIVKLPFISSAYQICTSKSRNFECFCSCQLPDKNLSR
jgi:hypothetical protein